MAPPETAEMTSTSSSKSMSLNAVCKFSMVAAEKYADLEPPPDKERYVRTRGLPRLPSTLNVVRKETVWGLLSISSVGVFVYGVAHAQRKQMARAALKRASASVIGVPPTCLLVVLRVTVCHSTATSA